jgi:ABC-type transport system involved in cytochrome c biogenesis permease component
MIRNDTRSRVWPVVWVAGALGSIVSAGILWHDAFSEGSTGRDVLQATVASALALVCVFAVIMAFRERLRGR